MHHLLAYSALLELCVWSKSVAKKQGMKHALYIHRHKVSGTNSRNDLVTKSKLLGHSSCTKIRCVDEVCGQRTYLAFFAVIALFSPTTRPPPSV